MSIPTNTSLPNREASADTFAFILPRAPNFVGSEKHQNYDTMRYGTQECRGSSMMILPDYRYAYSETKGEDGKTLYFR